MTEPLTFIFIGRAGSGKGTQAELLINHLKNSNPDHPVLYAYTGDRFREFIRQETYSGRLARQINDAGGIQPSFAAITLWSQFLFDKMQGSEHLIFDGTPRTQLEAQVLDTALEFYSRFKPKVIFLDVSNKCVYQRLRKRGRIDDHEEGIKKRLAWYEKDVVPALDFYRGNNRYELFHIDGDKGVDDIHRQIIDACSPPGNLL